MKNNKVTSAKIRDQEETWQPPYFALMTIAMVTTVAMPIEHTFLLVASALIFFYCAYQCITTFILENGSIALPWWTPLAFLFCCFGGYFIVFGG